MIKTFNNYLTIHFLLALILARIVAETPAGLKANFLRFFGATNGSHEKAKKNGLKAEELQRKAGLASYKFFNFIDYFLIS